MSAFRPVAMVAASTCGVLHELGQIAEGLASTNGGMPAATTRSSTSSTSTTNSTTGGTTSGRTARTIPRVEDPAERAPRVP